MVLAAALVLGAPTEARAEDALHFFKNYFTTGDYLVSGKSLWRKGSGGIATVDISISGVPANAEILAALLYVQTAEHEGNQWSGIAHARYRGPGVQGPGTDLGPGNHSLAKALNWDAATAPCWSVAAPGRRRLVTYRADVLPFVPLDPTTGRHIVLGSHRVQVPDSGALFNDDEEGSRERGGMGPRAVGASLVIVYRDPAQPYRAIVIYDGGRTKPALKTMTQTIQGFYAASATPSARMTTIVGDGRSFLSERVRLNGQVIATNPFTSADGPKWDNRTFIDLPGLANAAAATVTVEPHLLPDCLSFSAIVLSTKVRDDDEDGLVDTWEAPGTDLYDMGARQGQKDLFVEIGAMWAAPGTTYGSPAAPFSSTEPVVVDPAGHSHLPTPAVLKVVGDAFKNAPIPIHAHFDVGPGYEDLYGSAAHEYVIPPTHARGGELIKETACVPDHDGNPATPAIACQFPDYAGTVSWKIGFQLLRDAPVGPDGDELTLAEQAAQQAACLTPDPGSPQNCRRRFDWARRHVFHYGLYAHARGKPKSTDENNRDFHVPSTSSGKGDVPGGDFMVTLGFWGNGFLGDEFVQASTTLHELGHNTRLFHGGADPLQPNCKPNYLSVMSYLVPGARVERRFRCAARGLLA